MVRRLLALGAAAAAATTPAAARAELVGAAELRGLCRGEIAEEAQFRTAAGYRLAAQVSRERCRMYLLGIAEAQLEGSARRCIPAATPASEVAEALVEALLAEPEAAVRPVAELVRDALRARYRCGV